MSVIFVTVRDGIASVDETTVPEGIEVRVLDFDSMKNDPVAFSDELDELDTKYLGARFPRRLAKMTDAVSAAEAPDSDECCLDCGQVLELGHVCPGSGDDDEEEYDVLDGSCYIEEEDEEEEIQIER